MSDEGEAMTFFGKAIDEDALLRRNIIARGSAQHLTINFFLFFVTGDNFFGIGVRAFGQEVVTDIRVIERATTRTRAKD